MELNLISFNSALKKATNYNFGVFDKEFHATSKDGKRTVSLADIQKLSEEYKVAFVLSGAIEQTIDNPEKEYAKQMCIMLKVEHDGTVELKKRTDYQQTAPVHLKPMAKKDINAIYFDTENSMVRCFNQDGHKTMTMKEYDELKRTTKIMFLSPVDDPAELQQCLQDFWDKSDTVSKYSKTVRQQALDETESEQPSRGFIDFYKSPYPSVLGCNTWRHMTCGLIPEPEPFLPEEHGMMDAAFPSGIHDHNKDEPEQDNHTDWDMNSMYVFFAILVKLLLPMRQGKGEVMTAAKWTELLAQKKIPNGAFRAIVRGSHRLWYKSPKVWYWCHDIKAALLCGLKVELVQDGANNAMLYPNGECVRGDKVFGPYFKMLADVQARMLDKIRDPAKIKLYKGYMKEFKTTLFGFLASKLKRTVRYDTMEQYRQVKFDREKFEVLKEWPINQRKGIAMTYQPLAKAGQIFKFPWARFTIALVSYARFEMTRTLLDPRINLADIYYINTDGFVSKKASYPHLKLSDKVGDWKVQTLGEKKAKKRKAEEELAEAQAAKKMKIKEI